MTAASFLSGLDASKVEQVRDAVEQAHASDLRGQREAASKAVWKRSQTAHGMKEILAPRLKKWEVSPTPASMGTREGRRHERHRRARLRAPREMPRGAAQVALQPPGRRHSAVRGRPARVDQGAPARA